MHAVLRTVAQVAWRSAVATATRRSVSTFADRAAASAVLHHAGADRLASPSGIQQTVRGHAAATTTTAGASTTTGIRKSVPPAEPWRRHVSPDEQTPTVFTFFEKATSTWQYVVVDPHTQDAIVVDPVLDYDPNSGTISTQTADGLLSFIAHNALKVRRILETHAHADHLTAAQYFKQQVGGDVLVCIGQRISQVQQTFAPIYGLDEPGIFDETFDVCFKDEEEFKLGKLSCRVMHLPGHTPDHVGYLIGKAVFTGDSIFNPDVGSARVDFPGGNAEHLYQSMQRLLSLPGDYRLFVGHDYPKDRDQTCWSTVADQRARNTHIKLGTDETQFIEWRKNRDKVLGAPRLLHPSLQVNIRAGKFPPKDEQGRLFFRIPVKSDVDL